MSQIKTVRDRKQSLTKNSKQFTRTEGRSKSTVSVVKKSNSPKRHSQNSSYLIGWGNIPFCPPKQYFKKLAKNVIHFSLGEKHILYINNKFEVFGLGDSTYGQLGFQDKQSLPGIATPLMQTYTVTKCFCTQFCSFFLTDKNELYACGLNNRGQLGIGTNSNVSTPKIIQKLSLNYENNAQRSHSKNRINSMYYQCNILADKTNTFNVKRQRQYSNDKQTQKSVGFLDQHEYITQIVGGTFHTVALSNFGKVFYTGNLYKRSAIEKQSYITTFNELSLNYLKKITNIKSGLACFGMVNEDNKLFLMGILSQNIICDQPTQMPFSPVKDFEISDKCLYTINYNGEAYVTDITKKHLKTIKLDLSEKIKQVHCGLDYTIFVSNKNALFGYGDNSDKVLKKGQCQKIPTPMILDFSEYHVNFPNIKCSARFITSLCQKIPIIQSQRTKNSNRFIDLQKQNELLKILLQKKQKKSTTKTTQTQKQQKKQQKQMKVQFKNLENIQSRTFQNTLQIPFEDIELDKQISEGGYGIIYRATWRKTIVAVKIFKIDQNNRNSVRDFVSECRAMEALRHPNIVMFLGVCTKPPNFSIVLEYCEGGTLWSALQGNTEISWQQRRTFALDTAKGMNYLHCRKIPILHRDLKSLNLLLDCSKKIKLADFGWTKGLQNYMTGKIGTYQWMAPQVVSAQQYTQKADIFSFGIILWQIASRQPPYRNIPGSQVAHDVLHKDLRPQIPKKTPQNFANLMKSCWSKSPQLRPSFNQIIKQLETMKL